MRKLFSFTLLTLMASNASALNTETKDLLATIAMPLAVAAVSRVTGVPSDQLSNLVSTMNQANVPPAQFDNVIRYTPVALTDQNGQPFVSYVQTQASHGLTGDALVTAIVQQLASRYHITPQLDTTTVEPVLLDTNANYDNSYIPSLVLTRLGNSGGASGDIVDVVALPLAVAAVADIAGVPQDQLRQFIATLNNANMPPAQMIEVVRYAPVALVDDPQPFVQYVQQQSSQGTTGAALAPLIVQRLQPYYPSTRIEVTAPAPAQPTVVETAPARIRVHETRPRPIVVEREYTPPPMVMSRVAEVRVHPHGGPPGQLKKQLGLQTGAEVVHGKREKHEEREEGERQVVMTQPAPPVQPMAAPQVVVQPPQQVPVAIAPGRGDHGEGKGPGGGGPPGQAKQKEHGKGKGKD